MRTILDLITSGEAFNELLFLKSYITTFRPLHLCDYLSTTRNCRNVLPISFGCFSSQALSFSACQAPFNSKDYFKDLLGYQLFFNTILLFLLLTILLLFRLLRLSNCLVFLFLKDRIICQFARIHRFLTCRAYFFFFDLYLFCNASNVLSAYV